MSGPWDGAPGVDPPGGGAPVDGRPGRGDVRRPGVDRRELDEATPHAQLYLDRLRSAHLALSRITVIAFGGLVGALPLVALALPGLDERTVLGVPVAVLLLLAPYPVFVLIAWLYVRRADDLDDTFVALVSGDSEPDRPR